MSGENDMPRQLAVMLSRMERLRRRYMAERLQGTGLQGPMFLFLLAANRNPGASQDFISDDLGVDKSLTARMARHLDDLGYLHREKDEDNRRQYRLFLTDEGAALLPLIRKYMAEWHTVMTGGISPEEQETAAALLRRMLDNVEIAKKGAAS